MPGINFMNSNGAIVVNPGDTISSFCARIYGIPASQTHAHWFEFGRERFGNIAPIKDPHRIFAGETIYHIPTANGQIAPVGKKATPQPSQGAKPGVTESVKVTNIWYGVGLDIQYTLFLAGQQYMLFSLRSHDDLSRSCLLLVENYKVGLSVDLLVNGVFVIATGLHHPSELHNQNSSEKLDWDWNFALGLNWGIFIKNASKSKKAANPVANVVRSGTRMAHKIMSPELRDRVLKAIKASNMTKKEKIISSLSSVVKVSPDQLVAITKSIKKAVEEAGDINFESAYPRIHFIPAIGGGQGLGVTMNFGRILYLGSG